MRRGDCCCGESDDGGAIGDADVFQDVGDNVFND